MKIGLITWYNTGNYGTALQAYSLYEKINETSECYLINEFNYNKLNSTKSSVKIEYKMILFLKQCLRPLLVLRQIFRFGNISKGIKFIQFFHNIKQITVANEGTLKVIDSLDKLIVGSDQVWNPNHLNPFYLLSFSKKNNKYSYASSFGVSSLPNEMKDLYKRNLESFKKVTVRENSGLAILDDLNFGCNTKEVLDPVFLLDAEEWRSRYKYCKRKNFILCYFLAQNNEYGKVIDIIKEKIGNIEVIQISAVENSDFYISKDTKLLHDIGPFDFLSYIDNSSFVITDSFHALAFSLIFNKEFVVFNKFNNDDIHSQNTRIDSLLSKLDLKNKIYDESGNWCNDVNYNLVNNHLEYYINNSKMVLKDILNDK